MTDVTLAVPDMSCGHCEVAVEGKLDKLCRIHTPRVTTVLGKGCFRWTDCVDQGDPKEYPR